MDEAGIDFVKKCIHIVERRGLHEQGLYRIVGMQSKVTSVVASYFGNDRSNCNKKQQHVFLSFHNISDSHKTLAQKLSTHIDDEIELKTICSALKLYLRTLKEPIFTFKLHNRFIEAASKRNQIDFEFVFNSISFFSDRRQSRTNSNVA